VEELLDCLRRHLGVRFVHETAAAERIAAASPAALRPEALAALPAALRAELADALVSLDSARIAELIGSVSAHDPALGGRLAEHADRFDYTAILAAVQGVGDQTKASNTIP